ncbi:putative ribonuclease H-like domain-containing protein, partial [Tanacetum coccineum]
MVPYRKEDCAIEIQNLKSLEATDNNEDIDWTKEFDAEPTTFAMMALTESSEINRNKVIIEDWVDSDDEETDVSESQKETAFNSENSETSFENRSPNSQNSVGQESRTKGLGNKGGKLCFVCYSPNHLIKDCNLHERTFKHTQTHKPKGTQGSRETRPVWNNIQRVNHSNFSRNSRYPHQRRSFIPSAVLTRDGLISTARPTMTQTVPSKSTANVTYQGTARSRVPQAVLSRSTDGSYYPRMDNRRPRISSYSPSSSTVESQAVLPQTVKKSAMINPKQTWRPKGNYLDSVNRDNGSYTLKQFEYVIPYRIRSQGLCLSLTVDALKYEQEDKDNPHHAHASILKDSIRLDYVRSSSLISYLLHKYCAKEAHVLFTDKECLILSPRSKRLGQVNLKNNNKLVQGNLVRGLPSKTLKIDSFVSLHVTRGSNHRAPCKRTPQQNGVAERKNRTLIEAARTMLADSLLPIQFWAEAVNTACYVLNRVLVTNLKLNSYENFDGKILQHQFHETFGMLTDLFYTEYSRSIGKKTSADSGDKVSTLDDVEDLDDQQFIVHTAQPMHPEERTAAKEVPLSSEEQALHDELMNLMHQESLAKAHNDDQRIAFEEEKRRISIAKGKEHVNSTFTLSTANTPPQSTGNTPTDSDDDIPKDGIFSTNSFDAEEGGVADYNNMDSTIDVPSTPTLRIHKIHPQSQIIGKSTAGVQTRRKLKESTSDQHQALLSFIYKQNRTNHKDQQTCLFACFLSQEEPNKVSQALADESWVEAMQEELLQFKLQDVWVLCDLPEGKRVIGTKWVFRNKRDERGTIIKNKARLVAQGYRQEEGVDYDEVFAPVARIEAIRLFLAFASFMGFTVYQMDVKSAFLYGNITEEVYVKQPPGFEDPAHQKVSRGSDRHFWPASSPRAWNEILSTFIMTHGLRRGAIDKTLVNDWDASCLNSFKTDKMFAVCLVHDSSSKGFSLHAVKRILEIQRQEDDQYLGRRLFSWQSQETNNVAILLLGKLLQLQVVVLILNPVSLKDQSYTIRHHVNSRLVMSKVLIMRQDGTEGDFYQSIAYLTGCTIIYSLLVDPDLIGPWLQQFWATASLKVINDVPHIRAKVAGKKILISEATIRADLLFDDENGVDCFPKQVIWDLLRDIGYEGHISNGTPFLMYPRFIQLFLNKQLEGVARPQDFIPSVTLPSKIFTFMRKHSPKFSCRITPLTPPMLEVVTALAAEEAHSESTHSRAETTPRDAQGTPSQSAAQASISTAQGTADTQGTAQAQGTDEVQGTNTAQGATAIPKSPNDYTPTDASQTSGGDEGLLDLYALNREVRRLKKQTLSQAKQIIKLKTKLKKVLKMVQPVVHHHTLWVESQKHKKRRKKQKKQKKKVSSVKLGRNKDEGTLSEEHYVQDDYTADPFFEDVVDKDAAVTPDLERKSDETEEINIEEKKASDVKSGDTEELDLETFQSTARQSTITPRTLNFDDEAGPSSPIRPTQNIEPGPTQSQPQPQQPSQAADPKDKGKGILVEEPKKKKLTLQQIRALETTNDEEVARKIQAEWDAEEERKRLEELKKAKPKTT